MPRACATSSCRERFDRVSEAFISMVTRFNSAHTTKAVDVLPTPGGPESRAARAHAPESLDPPTAQGGADE